MSPVLLLAATLHAQAADGPVPDEAPRVLEVGGQLRGTWGVVRSPGFGALPEDPDGAGQLRALLHADLRPVPVARAYLQLGSATQASGPAQPLPFDVDVLHVQQAFVEASTPSGAAPPTLALRVGREEWHLGNGMLVDVRDGPNVRRAFDGAHLLLRTERVRADALLGAEVQPLPGVFDDTRSLDDLLWGVHGELDEPGLPDTTLDLTLLGATRGEVAYVEGFGAETRQTLAARLHGAAGSLAHDSSVFLQAGRFTPAGGAPLDIRSWGLASGLRWQPDAPMHLGAVLDAGISSGDRAPGDGRLGTFRAPFPETRELGAVTFLAPSNTAGFNAGLTASPLPTLHLQAVSRLLWRSSLADAIYAVPGFPLRMSDSAARFVGTGASGSVVWLFAPHQSLAVFTDAFWPGAFVASAPPADRSLLVAAALTLRF